MERQTSAHNAARFLLLSALFFFAATCALLCPAHAYCDDEKCVAYSVDASGNRTNYSSIGDAWSAAAHTTVVMTEDWSLYGPLDTYNNYDFVIDMNGHTIWVDADMDCVFRLYSSTTLTLKSSVSKTLPITTYWGEKNQQALYTNTGGMIAGRNGVANTGIYMVSHCTVTLDNVTVAGHGRTSPDKNAEAVGGGVTMNHYCYLNMKNSARVRLNAGYGGGIRFKSELAEVHLDNSSIDSNHSATVGGGIYASAGNVKITMENGSAIRNNTAQAGGGVFCSRPALSLVSNDKTGKISDNSIRLEDSNGGGICVVAQSSYEYLGDGDIRGVTISNNTATGNGGGVSIEDGGVHLYDCVITGNTAGGNGGGVYCGGNDYLQNCTITGNACAGDEEGGGIFVPYSYDVNLSGTCVIKDNTRGENGSADDLFLSANFGNTARAYIVGGINKGSKIGVRTPSTGTQQIGSGLTSNCYGAFFMDLAGYYVGYERDDGGNMWQNTGNLTFAAAVNGVSSARYAEGALVVADGTSADTAKHFWYWNADSSTGLYPVSSYINSDSMYNSLLTYSMPQNDTNLNAVYTDCATAVTVAVAAPIPYRDFPATATLTCGKKTAQATVAWYEVAANGEKTAVTGRAKGGKTYYAKITAANNQRQGLFYSSNTNVTVRIGSTNVTVSSTSVDSQSEELCVETDGYGVRKAQINNIPDASVSVAEGTTESALMASLPSSVRVNLEGYRWLATLATVKTDISWPAGLISGKVVSGTPGAEYIVNLPLTGTDEIDADGKTLKVSIKVSGEGTVADPVVTPSSGTYTASELGEDLTLKVTATCSTDGAVIKYAVMGEDYEWGKTQSYTDDGVILTGAKNDQAFSILKFWAEKTVTVDGVETTVKSDEVEADYTLDDTLGKTITVNCADAAPYASAQGALSSSFTVTGDLKESVQVTAPDQEDRTFDHWEWEGAPEGADLTQRTLTIDDFSLEYSGKITAVYTPTVEALDVTLAAPEAHQTLASKATSVTATTAAGVSVDITSLFADGAVVTWSPAASDGKAAHLTAYTASIELAEGADLPTGAIALKLNGSDTEATASVSVDADGKKLLVIQFPATASYKAVSVEPATVELTFDDALACQGTVDAGESAGWGLPLTVKVACSCGGTAEVPVKWGEVTGFEKSKLEAQTLTVTGELSYPEDVDTSDAPTTVTATIKIAAPGTVAKPTASVEPGTYSQVLSVELSCETDSAIIYYTTDGSDPAQTGIKYTSAIELTSDTVIRAVACREGMGSSEPVEFEYKLDLPKPCTVTFDSAGGSAVESQSVAKGAKASEPAAPTLEGFSFAGWTTADGEAYDFSTAVTSDITLYARWAASGEATPACLVIFDSNGGSAVNAQTVTAGETAAMPANPTRKGCKFKGWYTEDGSKYDFSTPVTGDITLTARWRKNYSPTPSPTPSVECAKAVDVPLPELAAGDELPATATATLTRADGKTTVEVEAELVWLKDGNAVEDGAKAEAGGYEVVAIIASSSDPAVKYNSDTAITFNGRAAEDGTRVDEAGNVHASFKVSAVGDISQAAVELAKAKLAYSGKWQSPEVASVTMPDGTELVAGEDYELRASSGKRVGSYVLVLIGIGDYTGAVTATYKIVPAEVKGLEAKRAGKKAAKLSWKKAKAQRSGVQVRYSLKKSMKGVKKAAVKGASAKAKTLKKLKSGKRCYFQARAYKVVNGVKYYSSWSKKVRVKVK